VTAVARALARRWPRRLLLLAALLGAAGLLGERRLSVKQGPGGEKLQFNGFDVASAPLLDLLYGVLQVLRDPGTDATLELVKILLRDQEPAVARLVGAALDAKETAKKHPEARLEPGSNLWDDVIPLARQLVNTRKAGAKQWLLEDVLDALADPRSRNLGGMFQNYFNYRDVHLLDPDTQKIINPGFKLLVDRKQADTGTNRSIQQRLFHIINNTNGARICNKPDACFGLTLMGQDLCLKKFAECDLFEIENAAVFYTQTIARLRDSAGNLTSTPKATIRLKTENMPGWLSSIVNTVGQDSLLKMAAGIDGFSTHPTTEAVNRQMFLDPLPASLALMVDPAKDIDGHDVRSYHVGTLLAWEQVHPQFSCSNNDPCHFYDAFRPLVQAFADHDAEKLFLDIIGVLHKHWASPASKTFQFTDPKKPDFAWGSAAVTWEPLLVEVLKSGELMTALSDLAVILKGLKLPDGTPAKTVLTRAAQFLLDPARSPGLTYRDGRTYSLTSDGKTKIPGGVSVFYLLADAFAAKRKALDRLAAGPDARLAEAWNKSTSDLVDIFLEVEGTGKARRFSNRRLTAVGQVLIDFLRARVASHRTRSVRPPSGPCKDNAACVAAFGVGSTCKPATGHCVGDLAHWLGEELPGDVERALAGPVVARAADFLRVLDGELAAKRAIYDLGRYLVDELASNNTFRAALTGLADLLQVLLDDDDLVPVAHALGRALDPARGLVPAALRFLGPAVVADSEQTCNPQAPSCPAGQRCLALGGGGEYRCSREMLSRVLRNAWKEQTPGKPPVQTLLDLSTELHRLRPGVRTPYSGPDFAEAFRQARDFLANTETGLVKFFEIIKNRCGGEPCKAEHGQ
jgi:hypothetical protein